MFRYNSDARLYVGRLSSQTSPRDLEILFGRYGRVCGVDRKRDYAFVEFSDRRYADEARYHLDGSMVDGCRIAVEFTKEFQVGKDSRPPHSGHCFNCGVVGHWARDCKAEDWTNSCYRCREEGHFMRDCKNSPKELRREPKRHSRSLSPRGGRRRRSYSRSRTPLKGDPRPDRDTRLSRSRRSPFPKARNPSVTPDETSTRYDAGDRIGSPVYGLVDTNAPIQDGDCSPINGNTDHDGSLPGDGTESPVYGLVDTRGHIQDDDFSPINGNKDHNALPRKQ